MGILKSNVIAGLIVLLATLSTQAQVAGKGTKHFEKDGLEFDYPAAWKTTEGSSEDSRYVELASDDKTSQLIVNWQFGAVLECEREGTRKSIAKALAL